MAREQLEVLSALDTAKTQWYHFTAIVIAGMGFFTDAYDLFCISLVTKLLGRVYYYRAGSLDPGSLPPNVAAAVNGVAFCGTLSGQLFFGWLGDRMGRKKVYGMTLMCMVLCSLASGLSFGSTPASVMATLCFFRFWLGFGIGGDYPLSATIMSEYANKKTRGAFIAAVFAMQGFGILTGGVVTLIVSAAFRAAFDAPAYQDGAVASTPPQADYVWRIILMFGAIPALLTYYWRMKMPETARYTALVAKNAKQAAADMSKVLQVDIAADSKDPADSIDGADRNSFGLFSSEFLHRHGLHLLGTATCWFLLDIAFYSQNLFQKDIFTAINWIPKARTMSALEEVHRIARAQTLIALCGTVPGYWFTVALIDRIGRFWIQLGGFFFMAIFMLGLAFPYHHWTTPGNHIGFVVLYGLTFFFANFGPNSTTFIVPAEIFPARLRSTCHGISAAAGKLGAIIGSFGFLYLAQNQDEEPNIPKQYQDEEYQPQNFEDEEDEKKPHQYQDEEQNIPKQYQDEEKSGQQHEDDNAPEKSLDEEQKAPEQDQQKVDEQNIPEQDQGEVQRTEQQYQDEKELEQCQDEKQKTPEKFKDVEEKTGKQCKDDDEKTSEQYQDEEEKASVQYQDETQKEPKGCQGTDQKTLVQHLEMPFTPLPVGNMPRLSLLELIRDKQLGTGEPKATSNFGYGENAHAAHRAPGPAAGGTTLAMVIRRHDGGKKPTGIIRRCVKALNQMVKAKHGSKKNVPFKEV